MTCEAVPNVTLLLQAWKSGDRSAEEKLFPVVFGELSRLARRHMARENAGHTLQTGALVNEAYLRLVGWKSARWENRAQFFAICSRIMRQILVDHARSRHSEKRFNRSCKIPFHDVVSVSHSNGGLVLELDDAMNRLAKRHPRKSDIIEMRLFGGLSVEETAAALNVSKMTVNRDFRFARAWLRAYLNGEPLDIED